MRAFAVRSFGEPPAVQDLPVPAADGAVLIRVRFAGVNPLDPQRILRDLPDREHANFLAAYREALDGARDPAGWTHLRRVLRLWSGMVIATNRPGFYEAQEAALAGTGGGMFLEDYIRLRRTQA